MSLLEEREANGLLKKSGTLIEPKPERRIAFCPDILIALLVRTQTLPAAADASRYKPLLADWSERPGKAFAVRMAWDP